MNSRLLPAILHSIVVALVVLASTASAQVAPYRVNDDQLKRALERIETGADAFRKSLDEALDRSRFDDRRAEDEINGYVKAFEGATDTLKSHFGDDHMATRDASEVLRRAAAIDDFMRRNPLTPRAQSDWDLLRGGLDLLAQAYQIEWNWAGEPQAYRVSDDEMKGLLKRVEQQADAFRTSLDRALDRSVFDDRRAEGEINRFVRDFEVATDHWKSHFDDDDTAIADATEVLNRAAEIDRFMQEHPLNARAQDDWRALRSTLDLVARGYNVSWTW